MLNDAWIKSYPGMIEPFVDHTVRERDGEKVLSYGLSSCGYDIRLADEVFVTKPEFMDTGVPRCIDPKRFNKSRLKRLGVIGERCGDKEVSRFVELPPGMAFASTIERVKMPDNVAGFLLPKSSYARCGISIINPMIDNGFEGNLTVAIVNCNPFSVRLYLNEGFAMLVLFDTGKADVTYAERGGLYQGSTGVATAKVSR